MSAQVIHGDCLDVLRTLPDNSVHAIVSDPPYGLGKEPDALAMLQDWLTTGHHEVSGRGFMNKEWDAFVPQPAVWKECLRVLKPGGHLLSFAGTRTMDLVALGLRIAGFELRDTVSWVYGSGFPKSLDIGKSLDKMVGAKREVIGSRQTRDFQRHGRIKGDMLVGTYEGQADVPITAPATPEAAQWAGWGTALKPAYEPIILARKPLSGTVAQNVLEHGVGGLNIDGCRVGDGAKKWATPRGGIWKTSLEAKVERIDNPLGRWPANFIHDGSEEVLRLMPESKGGSFPARRTPNGIYGGGQGVSLEQKDGPRQMGDSGSAARFFYCAKASKKDRDEGLEGFEAKMSGFSNGAQIHGEGYDKGQDIGLNRVIAHRNSHPTVKPTDLMRYLVRLITPPDGTVLDPYAGSGSTGRGAVLEGFNFIGIEREAEYVEIARARIAAAAPPLLSAADD